MTLPTLYAWPDFDDDGQPMSETVIGSDITPIAIVLAGEHHDDFKRLALAAPDLLAALKTLVDLIELSGPRRIAPNKSPIEAVRATLTKADWEAARAAIAKAKGA